MRVYIERFEPDPARQGRDAQEALADVLREKFRFYDWDAARREVRWMCSFDTSETDVDAFVAAIAEATTG